MTRDDANAVMEKQRRLAQIAIELLSCATDSGEVNRFDEPLYVIRGSAIDAAHKALAREGFA